MDFKLLFLNVFIVFMELILFLICCSVLIFYYKEDVVYLKENLMKENEDGIFVLFYL